MNVDEQAPASPNSHRSLLSCVCPALDWCIMYTNVDEMRRASTLERARALIAEADRAYEMGIKEAEEVRVLKHRRIIYQFIHDMDNSDDEAVDEDNGDVEVVDEGDGDEGIVQVRDDDTYDHVRGQETGEEDVRHVQIQLV